jgi:hypothetical protein
MCPLCLSTLGLIVAGSVSTGGLAALAVKISRNKDDTSEVTADPNERSISDVSQND